MPKPIEVPVIKQEEVKVKKKDEELQLIEIYCRFCGFNEQCRVLCGSPYERVCYGCGRVQ